MIATATLCASVCGRRAETVEHRRRGAFCETKVERNAAAEPQTEAVAPAVAIISAACDERVLCEAERAWSRRATGPRPAARGAQQSSRWSRHPQDAVGLNAVGLRTLPVLGGEKLANYLRTVRCRGHERFNSWDFCGQCGVHSAPTWRIVAESHVDIIATFTRPELGHGHDLSMNVECPWTWTVRGRGLSVDTNWPMPRKWPRTWRGHSVELPRPFRDHELLGCPWGNACPVLKLMKSA